KHHQGVIAKDQDQHHRHKEVEVGEEPRIALVVAHVACAVDMNQKADASNEQHHGDAQRVNQQRCVNAQIADVYPLPQLYLVEWLAESSRLIAEKGGEGYSKAA